MPHGTIERIGVGQIAIKLEVDGAESIVTFSTTPKVEDWVAKHPKTFYRGAVVEYAAKDGTIGKITPAGSFQSATKGKQEPINLDVNKSQQIGDAEKQKKMESAGFAGTTTTVPTASIMTAAKTGGVETIGMFDPKKIHGYEITDTCQIVQFEPITIKVVCDDPEEGRKALIDAWQIFGQRNEVTRETVRKHIENHLLKAGT